MAGEALRPFQRRFLRAALAPGVDTAALSMPRGNGKSWLAAHVLTRCLSPGDSLNQPGAEYLLCAGSIEQARLCYRFIRADLEPLGGFRFIDSTTRIGITHVPTNTRLRVHSSNGKTAFGIVGTPILVADEPGSWEPNSLMHDAIQTAMGKPGSNLRAIYIGTVAPSSGGWWAQMVEDGSSGSTYVQALQGDREKWDQLSEIRRCNPLTNLPGHDGAAFRKKLLEERDSARKDSRLLARFLSYRLNVPSSDESEMLLTLEDFDRMAERPLPDRQGQPIVGVDLGGGRAWSAAVAAWQGGRIECLAVCPGIPDVTAQEKRDRVPAGTYQTLVDRGLLQVAEGLRVQPPAALWASIQDAWGTPVNVICDRFRLPELLDAAKPFAEIEPRVARWSESSFDIRALRAGVKDGPLAVAEESRLLLQASLAVAMVKNDDQGNTRLQKRGRGNQSRDDVAAALTLVAGAYQRAERQPVAMAHVVV